MNRTLLLILFCELALSSFGLCYQSNPNKANMALGKIDFAEFHGCFDTAAKCLEGVGDEKFLKDGCSATDGKHISLIVQTTEPLTINGKTNFNYEFSAEGGIIRCIVSGVENNGSYEILKIDTSWLQVQKHHGEFFVLAKPNTTNVARKRILMISSGSHYVMCQLTQSVRNSSPTTSTPQALLIRNNMLSYSSANEKSYGFIDNRGNVVIAPIFSSVSDFENGLCAVSLKKEGKSVAGMIDKEANVVTPFVYKWIDKYCLSNRITVVDTNDKIGFLDKKGKLVIPCQYEVDKQKFFYYYPHFYEEKFPSPGNKNKRAGIAVVCKNGKFGAIDTNGAIAIPFEYDDMGNADGAIMVKKNGKYGFVDYYGKILIPIEYDDAIPFGPGRGNFDPHFDPYYDYHYDPYTYVRKGDEVRFVFMPNKKLKEKEYTQLTIPLNPGDGERYNLTLLPKFMSNMAPLFDPSSKKMGLVYYQTGDWWDWPKYDWVGAVWVPRRLVRDGDNYYYIDGPTQGNHEMYENAREYEFVSLYADIQSHYRYVARVKKNGKWGIIDKKGEYISQPQYDDIMPFDNFNGDALVEKGEKWGYIDAYDHVIWRPAVEIISRNDNGLSLLKVDDKYGYFAPSGLVVIKAQYDAAKDFSEGLAAVKIGSKWGFIDAKGDVKIPIVFESVNSFKNGVAHVKIDGDFYYIDKNCIIQGDK